MVQQQNVIAPSTPWKKCDMHTEPSVVQCALGWTPTGTLVIVWRGTANFRNVLTDIKFFSRKVIPVYMLLFLRL